MTPREAAGARRCARLEGAFALAILFAGEADLLIGARRGCPLAVGYGDGEMFVGSDALALAPLTERISLSRGGRLGRARRARAPRSSTPTARPVERADPRRPRCPAR